MWTLDDVKSMDFHVQSPNITVAEKLGLPNGSSVGLDDAQRPHRRRPAGGGAVVQRQRQRRRQARPRYAELTMSPRVVFEPIGEEIDCDEEESVLDAAFRHGYNLVYGCREGQCSACKAYLLEGEVVLKPYSTFALSESEESNGYTLLCRAMPEEDLVVELLHFDPDNYRLEHEIRDGRGDGDGGRGAHARHPAARAGGDRAGRLLVPARPVRRRLDPRSRDARRSFSMANLPGDGRIELIIKRYPGGRFSSLLDGEINGGRRAALHRAPTAPSTCATASGRS